MTAPYVHQPGTQVGDSGQPSFGSDPRPGGTGQDAEVANW